MLFKLKSAGKEQVSTSYLKERITALTNHIVDEVTDRNLVGLRIRNTENVQNKVVGISFRRRDPFEPDLVWDYFLGSFKAMLVLV